MRVRRAIAGLERRRLALGLAVAAVGAVLAWIAWQSVNGVPFQDRYELKVEVPADSPILKEGDAVRVAGRLAGLVTGVEPADGDVLVTAELKPEFAPVGADARANVKVRSILYLTYLEVFPGNRDDPLPEGGTIPVERTTSGVDLLEVTELFDRRARLALEDTVTTAGYGLAGRGRDLNAALADLRAATVELTPQLEAAVSRPGAIAEIIGGAARLTRGLRGARPDDLAAGIAAGDAVLGAIASREAELGEALELLPDLEREVRATSPLADPLLTDTREALRALEPAADELAAALPEVNEVLALGDQIRTETARLTAAINPVLEVAAPVLASLQPTVASIRPLLGPLERLVDGVAPYAEDIRLAGRGLVSATDNSIPVGQTAAGNPALRFAPVLTCHETRDPYPEPGETLNHSEPC